MTHQLLHHTLIHIVMKDWDTFCSWSFISAQVQQLSDSPTYTTKYELSSFYPNMHFESQTADLSVFTRAAG